MKKLFCFLCCIVLFLLSSCDSLLNSNDEQLAYILIDQKPIKTSYYIGEEFDKTGLCVYAYYIGSSSNSKKDVTDLVSISGFDSSEKNSYLSITVSYTDKGTTKSASFYVSINEIVYRYPYTDKNRTVKVSFQYYRRESTADSFQKYSYSNDSTDDINGTVVFKIDAKKGMAYSVENLVSAYKYYPDNSSTYAGICNINEDNIKNTKYIVGNNVYEEVTKEVDSENVMPYSFLFTKIAKDVRLSVYGPSDNYGGINCLLFEDSLISAIRKTEYTTFKGKEYPIFETNKEYAVTKATLLKKINNYFVCLITIETTAQDVDIDWPASLWGIDHLE